MPQKESRDAFPETLQFARGFPAVGDMGLIGEEYEALAGELSSELSEY
jgi:hypothetical protein